MEQFTPILKINPNTQSWKAKVQVVDKMRPRDSMSSTPTRYQNITLEDEVGTQVFAFIYNNNIALLGGTLELYKTYVITNAKVKNPRPMTKLPDPKYQYVWTVTGSTPVANVQVRDCLPLSHNAQITTFTELYKSWENHLNLKVRNKAGDFTEINEFIIVNQEAKPILLTMWTNFIKHDGDHIAQDLKSNAVILAKRLSITLFYDPLPEVYTYTSWKTSIIALLISWSSLSYSHYTKVKPLADLFCTCIQAQIDVFGLKED